MPFDSETRNDESGENGQGWITAEAFFTVSPGARQVWQRKEVKMNQSSLAEKREFLKSMEVEWQTLLKNQAAGVLSLEETPMLERAGRIVRWTLVVRRHDSSLSVSQTLTSLTSSHILRGGLYDSLAVRVQMDTSYSLEICSRLSTLGPDQERTTTLRQNAARWSPR